MEARPLRLIVRGVGGGGGGGGAGVLLLLSVEFWVD